MKFRFSEYVVNKLGCCCVMRLYIERKQEKTLRFYIKYNINIEIF